MPATLSAQARVFAVGNGRKTDPADAHSVALVALRTPNLLTIAIDPDLPRIGIRALEHSDESLLHLGALSPGTVTHRPLLRIAHARGPYGVMIMAVDLELGLVWDSDQENFEVNLRLSGPHSLDKVDFLRHAIAIDDDALRELEDREEEYGARLTEMVFANDDIAQYYRDAVNAAGTEPVHFRIHLDERRFHQLRWESLREPDNHDRPIATTGTVLFSRYLSGANWPLVPSTADRRRRALVVVGAPSDIETFDGLARVDRAGEVAQARRALGDYEIDVLPRATLAEVVARLDNDRYEIIYVVAHGWLTDTDDVPKLLLERPDGAGEVIDARRLAEQVHAVSHKPTLAVLVSCHSADAGDGDAKSSDGGALAGFGPRLAEAGVPAVIAMQGDISVATAQTFVTAFFDVFSDDPVVDRAVAKARLAVRDRPDWWAPVLFSRLRSGRAYHQPAFVSQGDDTWRNLSLLFRANKVTPVLGPGLADEILGSRADIAKRWAARWQMPIASHGRCNLAQVAQFLAVTQTPGMVPIHLRAFLMSEVRERIESPRGEDDPFIGLDSALLTGDDPVPAIRAVGRRLRARPDDPYRVAASTPAPIFVTTGWTDLLQDALAEQGKHPRSMCYPWYRGSEWTDVDGNDLESWPRPSTDEPWVCHLFGRLDDTDSLVLTEDDYFAWLTEWIGARGTLPKSLNSLKSALGLRSLLFVGYQLREWDFQVLLKGIQNFDGRGKNERDPHVGVQLIPEVDVIEPEAAQRYLESSLKGVKIFWSDTRTFMKELREQTGFGR